MTAADVQRHVS